MPIKRKKTKDQKLDAWEKRYNKNFETYAKGIPDTLYSIVSPAGREANRKATLLTNKQLGYSWNQVMYGKKPRGK